MGISLLDPVVPARYVNGLLLVAQNRGLMHQTMLVKANINEAELTGQFAMVSIKQFSRLYSELVKNLKDEACGMHSPVVPVGGIEMLCRVALSTSTLKECLTVIARCMALMMGEFYCEFQVDKKTAKFTLLEVTPTFIDRPLTYELTLFTLSGILAWLFGQRIPIESVHLPFEKPQYSMAICTLLAAPLTFESNVARLEFPINAMSLPVIRSPEEITSLMKHAPASFIEVLITQATLPKRLVTLMQQTLPNSLTLEQAAFHLAMSPRTLHRKLAAQNNSFQRIKDGWRMRQAIQMLTSSNYPVKQIASHLGFSDQATFQRAFTHWTGKPPGAFRRPKIN